MCCRETVDIAAPGKQICGTNIAGRKLKCDSGTSFATAIVSGAAAVLWAVRPNANYIQIK